MSTPARPPDTVRPDDGPATVEEVRTLRRWLWVVGIWAVAASIIAFVALIDSGEGDSGNAASAQSDVAQLEEELTGRLDNIEQELDERPAAEDVQRLQDQLEELEREVSQTTQELRQIQERADDLATRVEELEAGPPPEGEAP